MTNRISRLKTALFSNTREISLERALLYTASHRQTEGEPVILRRAKATAYILEHVEISIRDEELIAGNRTVKPGNDSNLLIVFYVQIMPDDFVMQLHRF